MKPTSMNETDRLIMNQLCKVCGEPAAGYHFGAFTCEGCKNCHNITQQQQQSARAI
ncbi:hypothetical protein DERP_008078 [Dermatophagoides pteronyssinus]|uniref:Nuclear receptor domain-containing protein n=1 Tax=Dermatophagoides pteronyssinus TaxID=6956 RepID=A0ABQ8JK98_DERPT|nr:hypothetical protein DERP_008078 [Dermatophagoides pteronyssinus]